ncbi:hypothetical protein AAG906_020831 [Vitis piasezkii]
MPKVILIVSAKMRNIALLQPQASKCEQCDWVSLEEVCVSLRVKEKPTIGSRRRNHNNASLRVGVISLIPSHGNSLSEHHYKGVGLMLFNCNGLIPMTYSFNGGWLAVMTSGQEIHVDLVGREYRNVIDGEKVTIMNLEAKFVPRG